MKLQPRQFLRSPPCSRPTTTSPAWTTCNMSKINNTRCIMYWMYATRYIVAFCDDMNVMREPVARTGRFSLSRRLACTSEFLYKRNHTKQQYVKASPCTAVPPFVRTQLQFHNFCTRRSDAVRCETTVRGRQHSAKMRVGGNRTRNKRPTVE